MKFSLLIGSLLFSSYVLAAPAVCTYEYEAKGTTVGWTAYKTPKKVGVKVKFPDFKITASKAPTVSQMLAAATFSINPSKIDSGDKARDAKIYQFFFKSMMNNKKISGKVIRSTEQEVEMELELNGQKKNVVMTSKVDEAAGTVTLKGAIDVLDFMMKDNLASITKACYEKHEGVTWPNVDLELVAMMKKSCK
jgi:polyisoprenoid-binding protein YceI